MSQTFSEGPDNPSTVTEQSIACLSCLGSDWINFSNASLPDTAYTQTTLAHNSFCFQTNCFYARALKAENFGFTIPVNSTITGIMVEVLRKASGSPSVKDTIVQLMSNANPAGLNKASGNYWPVMPSYETYGDSTDLWGISWTAADVNANSFGLFYKPENTDSISSVTAYVDHVRMTVYYQTLTGTIEHQTSGNIFSASFDAAGQVIMLSVFNLKSPAEIKIFGEMGQLVYSKNIDRYFSGTSVEKISTNNFSEGIYFVEIRSGEKSFSKKMMVTK